MVGRSGLVSIVMKKFRILALCFATLVIARPAMGAGSLPWLSRLEQSTPDRPLVIFFSVKGPTDVSSTYHKEVIQSREFLTFLGRRSGGWLWVYFSNIPYLDAKATLPPDLRGKLELARACGLDVSDKMKLNANDYPSLFLATGLGRITRLNINLEQPRGEVERIEQQIDSNLTAITESPLSALPAPGMLVVYTSSVGYAWDQKNTNPPQIFTHGNVMAKPTDPGIAALALGHDGAQFYAASHAHIGAPVSLVRGDRSGSRILFTADASGSDVTAEIRDIRAGEADSVYFSQTRKGAGKIFRLAAGDKPADPKPEIFYTSRLTDLQNWTGNFCFGRKPGGEVDTDLLYLIADRTIHRVGRKDGVWLAPQRIQFPNPLPVDAIEATAPDEAFVVAGRQLVEVKSWSNWRAVLTLPVAMRNVTVAR